MLKTAETLLMIFFVTVGVTAFMLEQISGKLIASRPNGPVDIHLICPIPNCSLIFGGKRVCKTPTPPESVQMKTIGSLPESK